ncbi:hypothetical protein GCM10011329_03990 [Stakelama pacifica]|nr:hypothetical protein GCM10011329_03990 [Stakelama pacifica]
MAFQRERHFGRRHAATVISHLDQVRAPGSDPDSDSTRPGIDCVLNEFFQRTGGSFHHLACGYTID